MISKDKQYRTRDGREVRIYATDGATSGMVHGAIKESIGWLAYTWDKDGGTYYEHCALVEVKPRHKQTVWLNMYVGDNEPYCHQSREDADEAARSTRIACLRLDLNFEEGEGL